MFQQELKKKLEDDNEFYPAEMSDKENEIEKLKL